MQLNVSNNRMYKASHAIQCTHIPKLMRRRRTPHGAGGSGHASSTTTSRPRGAPHSLISALMSVVAIPRWDDTTPTVVDDWTSISILLDKPVACGHTDADNNRNIREGVRLSAVRIIVPWAASRRHRRREASQCHTARTMCLSERSQCTHDTSM